MKPAYGSLMAAAVVALLAGCVPAATPAESPSPAAPTSAAPSPSPTVDFVPLVLPECEVLLPLAVAQESFSPETVLLGDLPPAEFTGRSSIASIGATLAAAPIARVCSYGVPNSDGVFFVGVAEVTEAQRDALQTELTGAGYLQSDNGALTTFDLATEGEVSTLAFTHVFAGSVWVLGDTTSLEIGTTVTTTALDAVRAANPTRGL